MVCPVDALMEMKNRGVKEMNRMEAMKKKMKEGKI